MEGDRTYPSQPQKQTNLTRELVPETQSSGDMPDDGNPKIPNSEQQDPRQVVLGGRQAIVSNYEKMWGENQGKSTVLEFENPLMVLASEAVKMGGIGDDVGAAGKGKMRKNAGGRSIQEDSKKKKGLKFRIIECPDCKTLFSNRDNLDLHRMICPAKNIEGSVFDKGLTSTIIQQQQYQMPSLSGTLQQNPQAAIAAAAEYSNSVHDDQTDDILTVDDRLKTKETSITAPTIIKCPDCQCPFIDKKKLEEHKSKCISQSVPPVNIYKKISESALANWSGSSDTTIGIGPTSQFHGALPLNLKNIQTVPMAHNIASYSKMAHNATCTSRGPNMVVNAKAGGGDDGAIDELMKRMDQNEQETLRFKRNMCMLMASKGWLDDVEGDDDVEKRFDKAVKKLLNEKPAD